MVKSTQEKKSGRAANSFHLRYLELCRSKNFAPLPDIKERNGSLRVLEFFGDKYRFDDWILIIDALFSDVTLHCIGVRLRKNLGHVYEQVDNEKRARLFRNQPVVFTEFIFGGLVNSISNCISRNKNLTTLSLEGLPFNEKHISYIAKALTSNETIQNLSFFRSSIGDACCEIVCDTVKHLANIESLNMSRCNLTVRGAEAVADMIKFQKIQRFTEGWRKSLRYRDVDPDSIPGLREILISQNPQLSDDGLFHITEVLKEDIWIKVVDVADCGLTDFGAKCVLECLGLNKSVMHFNLKQNSGISDQLMMEIRTQLGGDSESTDSGDSPKSRSPAKLMERIKFLEEQLSAELFKRKQVENLYETLHEQNKMMQKQLCDMQQPEIPEGFSLIETNVLENIRAENVFLKGRLKPKANKKVAHARRFAIRKAKSEMAGKLIVPRKSEKISKSEHGIAKEDANERGERIFVETSIGDNQNVNSRLKVTNYDQPSLNSFRGIEALQFFIKKKSIASEADEQYNLWSLSHTVIPAVNIPLSIAKASDTIGRVYTVHVTDFECFWPTSFRELKTREEAVQCRSPDKIRELYTTLISSCGLSNPQILWDKYKENMAEDILHRLQEIHADMTFSEHIYNETLILIENKVFRIVGRKLHVFGMLSPQRVAGNDFNDEIAQELNYDFIALQHQVRELIPQLLPEQSHVLHQVLRKIESGNAALFFLDAPGGTGKTFLLNLLLMSVRKDQKIAVAVASSGIAATLLNGGRTTHSVLKLALNLAQEDSPICTFSKNSSRGRMLQQCKLLVWDESTMSHKKAIEALNRTLQDLRDSTDIMGGMVVLLAGDFQQTLPVIQRGTPVDEIKACIKSSSLWAKVEKFSLKTNMRVHRHNDVDSGHYAEMLLKIGDGCLGIDAEGYISLSREFCSLVENGVDLIAQVFPDLQQYLSSDQWLCARVILAPKNDIVNRINTEILKDMRGEMKEYLSIDTVMDTEQSTSYPAEFLNLLELSDKPSHKLHLKVNVPVMLMRNLDAPRLCNGTRLRITQLGQNILGATILTGVGKGKSVIIPRTPIIKLN